MPTITRPIVTSALCSTRAGRYAFQSTIGTPSASSDEACPRPQVSPSRVAPPRPFVTSVVTAVRWSGSLAWRRPSRTATTTTIASVVPSEKCTTQCVEAEHQTLTFGSARATIATPAITITSALTAGRTFSRRPRPSNRANALFASTATSPTSGDREREAEAEREDEQHPEGDPVQRDRRQQHDERRRAGQQAAGDADREQAAPLAVGPWW